MITLSFSTSGPTATSPHLFSERIVSSILGVVL